MKTPTIAFLISVFFVLVAACFGSPMSGLEPAILYFLILVSLKIDDLGD